MGGGGSRKAARARAPGPGLGKGRRLLRPGSQSQWAGVRPVRDAPGRSEGTPGATARHQAAVSLTTICVNLAANSPSRGNKGARGGKSSEASVGALVASEGSQDRVGSPPSPLLSQCSSREVGSVGGLPDRSLLYQALMPCSVDTPELPCGIPGLCTAFKSPTPKFTKLLLAAAVADCVGGGPAG